MGSMHMWPKCWHFLESFGVFPKRYVPFGVLGCLKTLTKQIFLGFPLLMGAVGHFYQVLKGVTIDGQKINLELDRDFDLTLILFSVNSSMVFLCFLINNEYYMKMYELIGRSFYRLPESFKPHSEFMDNVSEWIKRCLVSVLFGHLLSCYIRNDFCGPHQELLRDKHFMCGTLGPTWYPIELGYFPFREIKILVDFYAVAVYLPAAFNASVINISVILLICKKLKDLTAHVEKFEFKDKPSLEQKSQMEFYVKYYIEIKNLINLLNKSCGPVLTLFLITVPVLCAAILSKAANRIDLFSIGSMFVLFLTLMNCCFFGQAIEDEVNNLHSAVLKMKWHNLDEKSARSYRIMLTMFKDQMAMRADPNVIFNYNYVVAILRLIYSYMVFLQRIQNKDQ